MDKFYKIQRAIWIFVTYLLEFIEARQCLKNADIGWRTGNIYSCTNPDLPECCEMFAKFTCCESGHVKHLREQLQLWGSVTVFVIIVAIAIVFLTTDIQIFSRPTLRESVDSFKSKFRRKRKDECTFSKFPEENSQPQPHCSKDNMVTDTRYKQLNQQSATNEV